MSDEAETPGVPSVPRRPRPPTPKSDTVAKPKRPRAKPKRKYTRRKKTTDNSFDAQVKKIQALIKLVKKLG